MKVPLGRNIFETNLQKAKNTIIYNKSSV